MIISDIRRIIYETGITKVQHIWLVNLKSLSSLTFRSLIPDCTCLNKTKKYYIVDDDRDDQEFLIEALTENDPLVECFSSFNGREAIINLKKDFPLLPDAIFLDLNMPRMNGKECLVELKTIPFLQDIPIIIYSTTSDQKEIQKTLSMGASHFLIKKSSFNELCNELSSIMIHLNIPALQ
jgi:CheY-like chemotaxis protein